jgi:hypothetical protein
MSCLKNPKRFLFFRYNGEHDLRVTAVRPFQRYGDIFVVKRECKLCGCELIRHIVKWDELLEMGLTNEQIKKAQSDLFGLYL